MYVTNMAYFGHLKDTENYITTKKHNDLFQIFENTKVSDQTQI